MKLVLAPSYNLVFIPSIGQTPGANTKMNTIKLSGDFSKSQQASDLMTEIESTKSLRDSHPHGSADWHDAHAAMKSLEREHAAVLRSMRQGRYLE